MLARIVIALAALTAAGCAAGPPASGPSSAPSPRPFTTDAALQRAVEEAVAGFQGEVGVYIEHVPTGRGAALQPDSLFPTASTIKLALLGATFDAIAAGRLDYGADLVFRDSLRYADYDITGGFRDGQAVPLRTLVSLMLSASDNTASLWLQHLAGGGQGVNAWLASAGFESFRVNSRTPGRESAYQRYGWGQATPRDLARFMTDAHRGRLVHAAASEEMLRVLTRTFWDDEAVGQVPPEVQVASKQGAVSAAKSEVALVFAPSGPYVLVVMTRDQADQRWVDDNAGLVLIRDLSALAWDHFEPDRPYRPPADPAFE